MKELFLYFENSPHRLLRKLMTFVCKHCFVLVVWLASLNEADMLVCEDLQVSEYTLWLETEGRDSRTSFPWPPENIFLLLFIFPRPIAWMTPRVFVTVVFLPQPSISEPQIWHLALINQILEFWSICQSFSWTESSQIFFFSCDKAFIKKNNLA